MNKQSLNRIQKIFKDIDKADSELWRIIRKKKSNIDYKNNIDSDIDDIYNYSQSILDNIRLMSSVINKSKGEIK